MRRTIILAPILFLAVGALPMPATAGGTPDLAVELRVYKGDRDLDRVHSGPLVIGREYTYVFVVRNEGTAGTSATLRFDYGPKERAGYTWWSVPVDFDGFIVFDDTVTCRQQACTVRLGPGDERWVVGVFADANAPGRARVAGRATSSAGDTDASDDRAADERRVTCSIVGTDREDVLRGTAGTDSICGGGGKDTLVGVGRGDKLFGGAGNDLLRGDRSPQMFVGGRGTDTVSYKNADAMVYIFLREMTSNGWARDQLIKPEVVLGSRFGDYMEGSGRGERIDGWAGNDELFGDAGPDILVGGNGNDEFDSHDAARDIVKGGRGYDVAYSDGRDVRRSAAYSSYRTFPDRS